MSIGEFLQKSGAKVPGDRRKEPLWKGPEDDGPLGGISYSMLSTFLVCRERFRIKYCEGLDVAEGWNHRIGYGSIWHAAEEEYGRTKSVDDALRNAKQEASKFVSLYRTSQNDIDKWWRVCKVQFPLYVEYWKRHPEVDKRRAVEREKVFHTAYELPSGRVIYLRGKRDGADELERGLWVVENKTKGDIREGQMARQLSFDLQTMIYVLSLMNEKKVIPAGVLYNVVRRPLSGGTGSIVQKQATKGEKCSKCKGVPGNKACPKCGGDGRVGAKPAETIDEYFARLGAILAECPEEYFMRWKVALSPMDIERFQETCFNPLLEHLCHWYDLIGKLQLDPFDTKGHGGIHWRHPFGVYNVLDEGGSSDLDEYLASGSTVGLERRDKLFSEL